MNSAVHVIPRFMVRHRSLFHPSTVLAMVARRPFMLPLVVLFGVATIPAPTRSQAQQAEPDPSREVQTRFAPGILTVIPPAPEPEETFTGPLSLSALIEAHPEISWKGDNGPEGRPHYDPRSRTLEEMAKQVILRRETYCLEFAFKPLRKIYIDIPRPDGRLQRKLIWYMVYRLRYRGGDLRPAADELAGADVYRRIESVGYASRRAFPLLVLENHVTGKRYVDRILPAAKEKIAVREKITATLHNSVEISSVKIPRTSDPDAPGVWGVATWEDIDPKLDFLTVNVFGLTNAFEVEGLEPDAEYRKKALSLHFYRPGDAIRPEEDPVFFGVPAYDDEAEQAYVLEQYGLDERLDYRWRFR